MVTIGEADFKMKRNAECVSSGKKSVAYYKLTLKYDRQEWNNPAYKAAENEWDKLRRKFEKEYPINGYHSFGEYIAEMGKYLDIEAAVHSDSIDMVGDPSQIHGLAGALDDFIKEFTYFSVKLDTKNFKAFEFEVRYDRDKNKIEPGDLVVVPRYKGVRFGKVVRTTPQCWGFEDGYITGPGELPHVIKKANGEPVKISEDFVDYGFI